MRPTFTKSGEVYLGFWSPHYDYFLECSNFITQDEIEFIKNEILSHYNKEWEVAELQDDPYDTPYLIVTNSKFRYYWVVDYYGVKLCSTPVLLYPIAYFKVFRLMTALRSGFCIHLEEQCRRSLNKINAQLEQIDELCEKRTKHEDM